MFPHFSRSYRYRGSVTQNTTPKDRTHPLDQHGSTLPDPIHTHGKDIPITDLLDVMQVHCRMRSVMNSIVFSSPIVSIETHILCIKRTPMMTLTMRWWSTSVQPSLKTVTVRSCFIVLIFPMGQWNVIVVDGKPGTIHNHLMCSLPNLYVSTWRRNPAHTSTLSGTVRLLVSFFEYVPWD